MIIIHLPSNPMVKEATVGDLVKSFFRLILKKILLQKDICTSRALCLSLNDNLPQQYTTVPKK